MDRHPHSRGGGGLPCPQGSGTHTWSVAPPRPAPKRAPTDTFSSAWQDHGYVLTSSDDRHDKENCQHVENCLELVSRNLFHCYLIQSIHVLTMGVVYKLQHTYTRLFSPRSMHQTRLSVNPVCSHQNGVASLRRLFRTWRFKEPLMRKKYYCCQYTVYTVTESEWPSYFIIVTNLICMIKCPAIPVAQDLVSFQKRWLCDNLLSMNLIHCSENHISAYFFIKIIVAKFMMNIRYL